MGWIWLLTAIGSEIAATVALKQSAGFTRLFPSIVVVVGYLASFALLSQALKTFDVGTAYAIWSGVGTAVIALIGVLAFGEAATVTRIAGTALIIAGVVLLNLGGSTH